MSLFCLISQKIEENLTLVQALLDTRSKNLLKKEHDDKNKLLTKQNLADLEQTVECLINQFLSLDAYCHSLSGTNCVNLKRYLLKLVVYYYEQLEKILINEFEDSLKSLSYPCNKENVQSANSHTSKLPSLSADTQKHANAITEKNETYLRLTVNRLLKIEAFQCNGMKLNGVNVNASQEPHKKYDNIVIYLLVKPLEKRFRYHFFGSRKTNNLDKVRPTIIS